MDRIFIASVIFLLLSLLAHADLAQDLRQLRNTISETSKTGKELGDLAGYSNETNSPAKSTITSSTVSEMREGDVLVGKIANIKLYQEADKKAKVLARLGRSDELIFTGVESNGFYSVASNGGDGWVEKMLVKKR